MSHPSHTSPSDENLDYAIEYGRCLACDGVECPDHPEACTCCRNCGNHETESCVCCKHCWFTLDQCQCKERISDVWSGNDLFQGCTWCGEDEDGEYIGHQAGERCPNCCAYCKNHELLCKCCKKCGTTPCICCNTCGELRIKCKCWSAKVLSHFMRRLVHYHKMEQQLHVCPCPNTAALLVLIEEY